MLSAGFFHLFTMSPPTQYKNTLVTTPAHTDSVILPVQRNTQVVTRMTQISPKVLEIHLFITTPIRFVEIPLNALYTIHVFV